MRIPRPRKPNVSLNRSALLRAGLAALALLALAAAGTAGWLLRGDRDESGASVRLPAVAPTIVLEEQPDPEVAEELGFPAFATRNTTRVGGADPVAIAAGVALASYPSVGGVGGPPAVVLAPRGDWHAALAAASLAAPGVRAPLLLGSPDEIPGFTAEALAGLAPSGTRRGKIELVAIGDVSTPDGLEVERIRGARPAEIAKQIDRLRARLSGVQDPDHLLIVPSEEPALAMPAAAWAAISGDPIGFAGAARVPDATLEMLERHPGSEVYVLGGESGVGPEAVAALREATEAKVTRVGDDDPVKNAADFARYDDGSFGWNINDPGHGFVLAGSDDPMDAAAAASLSSGGKPGPLLLAGPSATVPRPLRSLLLDTKPGYVDDPARAFYNHIWLIGDTGKISLELQARVDELTRLTKVRAGSGGPSFGGSAEPEAEAEDLDEGGTGDAPADDAQASPKDAADGSGDNSAAADDG